MLRLADGRTLKETVAKVKGGPHDPMTAAEIVEKLTLCGGTVQAAREILDGDPSQVLSFW
jgi:hypothetical protein